MNFSISEHFDIREFVSKQTFDSLGIEECKKLVGIKVVSLAEVLRSHFGYGMTINNWHKGGNFNWRGLRIEGCGVGKITGQHYVKPLNAIDFNITNFTPLQVYNQILKNEAKFLEAGITRMENIKDTPTWTHVDMKVTKLKTIQIVNG